MLYSIYVVLFTWLFPEKSRNLWSFFRQVPFIITWCHYVAVLLPANRYIADRGFEYRYIAPLNQPMNTQLSQITQSSYSNHQQQMCSKNRISQILIRAVISSWMCHLISDVISDVWRMGPVCCCVVMSMNEGGLCDVRWRWSLEEQVFRVSLNSTHVRAADGKTWIYNIDNTSNIHQSS